ncbi:MAG: conjugal transfer protein TraG N-terminal domain-containing protein, partial [Pseudomonadota bacterium]
MIRKLIYTAPVVAPAFGGNAHAIDTEFVTVDGFDTIVAAFNFIALFFSNDGYLNLVYTFAVFGLAFGAIVSFLRASGDFMAPVRTFILFVFSAALFQGTIISKGNVEVYDPVTNRTQTVADVPDVIVLLAWLTNSVQQVAEQVSAAAIPAISYDDVHDGTLFDLLTTSIQGPLPIQDEAFFRTLKSYYSDCVFYAEAVPSNNLTFQELVHDSNDLTASFAKAAVPSGWAAWFSNGDPRTGTDSCQNIWNDRLFPVINSTTSFNAFEQSICRQEDFDPADPLQLAACREDLDRIPAEIYGQASGDRIKHYRQVLIARALRDANFDANPAVAIQTMANVQQLSKAVGILTVFDSFGPSLRSAFLGASLVMLPVIFLFIMTPLFKKVLQIALSLFVFAALWSVLDTALDQITHVLALRAFGEIAAGGYAYNDIMTSPTASAKALASFGTMRLVSVTLATIVAVQVFQLSGAPFSAIGSQIQGEVAGAGASAGTQVLNPLDNAQLLNSASSAIATQRLAATGGQEAFAGIDESRYRVEAAQSAEGHALGGVGAAVGRVEGTRRGASAVATSREIMGQPGGSYAVGSLEGRYEAESMTEGLRA